jgi:hypothetical protein
LGLRILGIRGFDGYNRVEALAQKVEPTQGHELQIVDFSVAINPQRAEIQYYKNRTSELREMVFRRQRRIFNFPYYSQNGKIFLFVRPEVHGLPMPQTLHEVGGMGYLPQPIVVQAEGGENLERKSIRLLKMMMPSQFGWFVKRRRMSYFPSPDVLMENAHSIFVRLKHAAAEPVFDWEPMDTATLFQRLQGSTAGNADLEIGLYQLYLDESHPVPEWTGAQPRIEDRHVWQMPAPRSLELPQNKSWSRKRWFLPSQPQSWNIGTLDFREASARGSEVSRRQVEAVVAKRHSSHSLTFLPVTRANGEIYVGLITFETPAPQAAGESSRMWTLPTMRLSADEKSLHNGVQYFQQEFEQRFKMKLSSVQSLGGSYQPDADLSTDVIHPYVAEIEDDAFQSGRLGWFSLKKLILNREKLQDGRLLLSLYRLAHAEGLLR